MSKITDSRNYVAKKRKFNDAWAFILFLIVYIGSTTYMVMNALTNKGIFNLLDEDIRALMFGFGVVGIFSIVSFACFRFIPEFFLKFTICSSLIFIIIPPILYPPVGFFVGWFFLLTWGLFVYKFWSFLKYVSNVLKQSMKIVFSRFVSVLVGVMFSSILLSFQVILLLSIDFKKFDNSAYILAPVILSVYWFIANTNYFYSVYITSITVYHFLNLGDLSENVFGSALVNSLYSLGSISFAGLVIAVVSTIKCFLNEESNRENRERNILTIICIYLTYFIISILEDIIKFGNELTMPYIAIHGDSYVESARKSFELSVRGDGYPFIGMAALRYSFGIMFLLVSFCTVKMSMWSYKSLSFNSDVTFNVMVSSFIPLIFYFTLMTVISSSFIALIYLHAENDDLIQATDSDVFNALDAYKQQMHV